MSALGASLDISPHPCTSTKVLQLVAGINHLPDHLPSHLHRLPREQWVIPLLQLYPWVNPSFTAMAFAQSHAGKALASDFFGGPHNLFERWLRTSSRGRNVIWLPLPSPATPAFVLEAGRANTGRGSLPSPVRSLADSLAENTHLLLLSERWSIGFKSAGKNDTT